MIPWILVPFETLFPMCCKHTDSLGLPALTPLGCRRADDGFRYGEEFFKKEKKKKTPTDEKANKEMCLFCGCITLATGKKKESCHQKHHDLYGRMCAELCANLPHCFFLF